MITSSGGHPSGAATPSAANASTTEPSAAPSSPPESSSSSTTDETGLGPFEIARLITAGRMVDPETGFLPESIKRSAARFLGDGHYLSRLAEVGHNQAAEEACEKYGHPGENKGMCVRCSMDRMTQRQAWLQTRGRA